MNIFNINPDKPELKPFRSKPRARKTEFPNFKYDLVKKLKKSLQFYKDIR